MFLIIVSVSLFSMCVCVCVSSRQMRKIQPLPLLSFPLPTQAALEVCGVTQAGDKHLKPSFRLPRPPRGCRVLSPFTVSGLGLLSCRREHRHAAFGYIHMFYVQSDKTKQNKKKSMFNFLVLTEPPCSLSDDGDDRKSLPGVGSSL